MKCFSKTVMRNLKIMLAVFIMVSLYNCKSTKAIVSSGEVSSKLTSKQLIKAHLNSNIDFKTLQAKVKINISQGEKSQGAGFNLRIEKDKVIWLKESILGLVRMKITPDQVQFYNKIDNTYFDGDYKLLSDFVGFELDFQKVQNILMGQAIYDLKENPHKIDIQGNSYVLQPKKQDVLLELFYVMNASHFKLNSLQLAQSVKQRFLQVDYTSYQEVEQNIIPKQIKIVAVEGTDEALVDLEMRSVTLNGEVRFPFRIPSGYKEIELK